MSNHGQTVRDAIDTSEQSGLRTETPSRRPARLDGHFWRCPRLRGRQELSTRWPQRDHGTGTISNVLQPRASPLHLLHLSTVPPRRSGHPRCRQTGGGDRITLGLRRGLNRPVQLAHWAPQSRRDVSCTHRSSGQRLIVGEYEVTALTALVIAGLNARIVLPVGTDAAVLTLHPLKELQLNLSTLIYAPSKEKEAI